MNITVEPPVGDYFIVQLDVTYSMLDADSWGSSWFPDIDEWCYESFGEQDIWGEQPITGWKRMRNKYFFTKEEMVTMFMLVWG